MAARALRIVIATVQVPFVRGGAEVHAEGLANALNRAGHRAEIVAIPFKWYPPERIPEQMLACRLLDLTESSGRPIDRLIGLRFPAYLIPHPHKILWILHQHRTAYDLWDTPLNDLKPFANGLAIRDAIHCADGRHLPEAKAIYTNSHNVSRRLKTFCGLDSTPLYHPPPNAEAFYSAEAEDYVFFPSRINRTKRQHLVLEALAATEEPVVLRIAGVSDDEGYGRELKTTAERLALGDRLQWLGEISEEEKRHQYAHSLGVVYPPVDEDLGYVTLEAMLAAKPVVTCVDSGGPLEFIADHHSGMVVAPEPRALAAALDTLWRQRGLAATWGRAALAAYRERRISWETVVEVLTR